MKKLVFLLLVSCGESLSLISTNIREPVPLLQALDSGLNNVIYIPDANFITIIDSGMSNDKIDSGILVGCGNLYSPSSNGGSVFNPHFTDGGCKP